MERIKSAALAQAFVELAVMLAVRMDHGHYRALNARLVEIVERMPVVPLKFTAGVQVGAVDLDLVQQNSVSLTINAVDDAFKAARKRLRR